MAMARRLDDRGGLATVLMRSYWSHGTTSVQEILDMLTEARDLGEQLGDTEILAEAMSWRVPALVALCDLASAEREIPALRETAERTAQPFMLHVAEQYASALALCAGRLDDAETIARRSYEWGRLLTGRDSSASTASRCSASGASRAAWRSSRRWCGCWPPTPSATAPGGRAWSRCSSSSAWRPRRAGSSGASRATGSTRSGRRCGSPRSSTSPTRAARSATRPWRR